MKAPLFRSFALLSLLLLGNGALSAQETADRHPILDNRFTASLGAFVNKKKLELNVQGTRTVLDDTIDFGDRWGLDSTGATFDVEFKWRFGEKWSVAGQYFDSNDTGRATLTEDILWGDYTLRAGTNVGAGIGMKVARVFFGRAFSEGQNHEFGAGLGFHWMEISAFVDGELFLNDESTGARRESVKAAAPLPNLGAWYDYALSDRWLIRSRVDWLSVSFQEYSGGLLNGSLGVTFMPFDRFGVSLAYQHFNLDVDVDKSDWRGGADLTYHGPFLSVTATW